MSIWNSILSRSLLHVIGQFAKAILVNLALTVTQPRKAISTSPDDIEVLSSNVLESMLEVQDGPCIWSCDNSCNLSVLIPRTAGFSPDSAPESLLRPFVEVGYGLCLGVMDLGQFSRSHMLASELLT